MNGLVERHSPEGGDDGTSADEADRMLRDISEWFANKLRRASLVDVVGIVTNLILIGVGVAAACIYDGQLAEMRHTNELTQAALNSSSVSLQQTLDKMQQQIDASNHLYSEAQKQTQQATITTGNSSIQAATARQSLSMNQRQFHETMRPRIVVLGMQIADLEHKVFGKPVGGNPVVVNIPYKNLGKTAAFDVTVHRHLLFEPQLDQFRADPMGTTESGTLDVDGQQFTSAVSVQDTYKNESFNVDLRDLIKWNGTDQILVFGSIIYLDSEGARYCTPYASAYSPQSAVWVDASDFVTHPNTAREAKHHLADLCPNASR